MCLQIKTTAAVLLAAAGVLLCGAAETPQWKDYTPGSSDKKKVFLGVEDDALTMQFTAGDVVQAWGAKNYKLVGQGRTVRMEIDAKASGCPKSGKNDWVQIGFQGKNAQGVNIKSYNLQYTPLDKLTDWTHLTYTFTIPGKGDAKWDTCTTLSAGFSARCSHGAKVQFKNFKYTELPANFVDLKKYRPGKGPAGTKADISVVDDSVILVKYLPGSIRDGQVWFSQAMPIPEKGRSVKMSIKVRCTEVADPRAVILFSFQGFDSNNRNIKAYVTKQVPYYSAEDEFVEFTHIFKIPQKDAKWDKAVKLSASFSSRSTNGKFEFKDFNIESL